MSEDIKQLIKEYENEIELGNVTRQRKRFLESQIEDLSKYIESNLEVNKIPNALEIFCSLYPEADECREYDV